MSQSPEWDDRSQVGGALWGRTNHVLGAHWVPEEDDGGHNHNDSFQAVTNRVSNR